jgi:hypothetical protein
VMLTALIIVVIIEILAGVLACSLAEG